jgi:hypothetical protein
MGFLDFMDKILPPSEAIERLKERQRELDEHCRWYFKSYNPRDDVEEECKKRSS